MKITAVMPAYNEEGNIQEAVSGIKEYVDKIIVVDDGSRDSTYFLASKENDVISLRHAVNLGKGAALKTGCDAALKLGFDVIICVDADNQHNPKEIPLFIEQINQGNDIVFGSRVFNEEMPGTMSLGNKVLSILICKFFHVLVTDTQSGYRAFTDKAYEKIRWQSRDYAVETEMIIKTGENKLKFSEIEIETIYHDNYKGTTPLTGVQILFKILKWKFL